jgi:hypothetical protein
VFAAVAPRFGDRFQHLVGTCPEARLAAHAPERAGMKEHLRLRFERLMARYEQRLCRAPVAQQSAFLSAFETLCANVIEPTMAEVATFLRAAGHSPAVSRDEQSGLPAIELVLGLRGARDARNAVGFRVIQRDNRPLEIQGYLAFRPSPFDLDRYSQASELTTEIVEQVLLDAVEQLLACNAP